ncbi:oligosaccharide flippase family protein [Azomonas macrocytogenes]|uniref:O-antigen/teichoic acid export membrane protein n=1 Tax=Azomonas macrocytogenes TaxID=69962 RepID=A0A839T9F4_AZOMA|nr:oligosaccharide flippase family protein [Azomonas macrocytogenes]MBB3104844.1 O-antigen/teichoic acid export membrane protein [Azomonas macrocytogenes]
MRDHALMGVTTAARTAVALGTLLILARTLGPSDFGFVSIAITWSAIVALVTDYGFGMRALRDIGAERERAGYVMSASLAAKTLLVIPACLILIPLILLVLHLQPDERLTAVMFLLGSLAFSYGDLSLTVFRSIGQFHRETKIVVLTAIVHFVLLGLAIWLSNDLLSIGLAFLVSRTVYALCALFALSRILELKGILRNSWKDLKERFRTSTSFAIDSGATNIFAQLDVILVNHLAGREAAGIYFAGARLLQGAVPFTVLLASIHIPRLAHQLHNKNLMASSYSMRILGEYMILGVLFALGFYFIGPLFTDHFLGPDYIELNALWLAFACFTATRFLAAGFGVQLIALGTGFLRTFGIITSGIVTVICYWIFIPAYGIAAAPWVSTLGMTILSVIYGHGVYNIFQRIRRSKKASQPASDQPEMPASLSLNEKAGI